MTPEQLWQQLQTGDRKAFEQLYRQQVEGLLQYGHRFSSDPQLVEDVVQELFIELWNKHDRLQPVQSVRSYLFVSLRRKVIRSIQSRNKRMVPEEVTEQQLEVVLSVDEEMIKKEFKTQQLTQLRQAIAQLSNRQKEALYLKYQQNLDYEDLCEVMDLNYQSARNLVASAIKRLKGILYWLIIFLDF